MPSKSAVPERLLLSLTLYGTETGVSGFAYTKLVELGYSPKSVTAKFRQLVKKGFLKSGMSLRGSSLTPEGMARLAELGK